MDLENRLVVAKGGRERVAWTGSLGLVDANNCIYRNNKVLVDTIGKYIQSLAMEPDGG